MHLVRSRGVKSGRLRAMLLEDVPDYENLESKVINPLLEMELQ